GAVPACRDMSSACSRRRSDSRIMRKPWLGSRITTSGWLERALLLIVVFVFVLGCAPGVSRGFDTKEGAGGGSASGGAGGAGGEQPITTGAELVIEPAKVTITIASKAQPATQSFKALVGGVEAPNVTWSLDSFDLGTIDKVGNFATSGLVGGTLKVIAK